MEKKQKRFYKVNEIVWVISKKKEGKIKSINKDSLKAVVTVEGEDLELELWSIDKLKYSAKEKLVKSKKHTDSIPTVYFAKVRENAIIPSKRDEDAGYDLYVNVEPREIINGDESHLVRDILCPALRTTLVPTGIAMALPKTHYFNAKHERGSTGKISMSVLSGVVDSGYRGEVFVAITPLYKDVLITSEVTETKEEENVIYYPYSKAICQGTIELVPKVHIEEISFEDLKNIKSERGTGALGSSNK